MKRFYVFVLSVCGLCPLAAAQDLPPVYDLPYPGGTNDYLEGYVFDAAGAVNDDECERCFGGSVVVYRREGLPSQWPRVAILGPSYDIQAEGNRAGVGRNFGVCQDGESGPIYLVTGAPGETVVREVQGVSTRVSVGAVYFFRFEPETETWELEQRFQHDDPQEEDALGAYGTSVACDGGKVVAQVTSNHVGTFFFRRIASESGGTPEWIVEDYIEEVPGILLERKISAPGPQGDDFVRATWKAFDLAMWRRVEREETVTWTPTDTLAVPPDAPPGINLRGSPYLEGDWVAVQGTVGQEDEFQSRLFVYHYLGPEQGWVIDANLSAPRPDLRDQIGSTNRIWPGQNGDGEGALLASYTSGTLNSVPDPTDDEPALISLFRREGLGDWREVFTYSLGAPGTIEPELDIPAYYPEHLDGSYLFLRGGGPGVALDLRAVLATSTAPPPEAALGTIQAWPNPASGAFRVAVGVPEGGRVRLVAYNVLGRAVAVLGEAVVALEATFEARVASGRLAAGVYVLRAEGERGVLGTGRVVVVR